MEGSGGELRCLKSRKTEVNPVLNTLVKPLVFSFFFPFLFFLLSSFFSFLFPSSFLWAESSGDGFFFPSNHIGSCNHLAGFLI